MNIHEYQAKAVFARYGVSTPSGKVAFSVEEAAALAAELGGSSWMVKAQVHAGGRGKAGGVKKADSLEELKSIAGGLLGSRLVTKQSGADGQPVQALLIESPVGIARELYLGLLVDRAARRVSVIASSAGGMDIEEVAATQADKIITRAIHPVVGLQAYQCREIGFALGLSGEQLKQFSRLLGNLYRLFVAEDLSLLEINPLVVTDTGELIALDAKMNLDDNALYRHKDLAEYYDPSQADEKEDKARAFDLNYVALDGNIACMVNGAGLAMATMDLIKLHGGEPANFLDVGGTATAERVTEAFKLIMSDQKVKAILVNIFGGIVRCDLIADGIVQAVREAHLELPLVVRLEGTNAEKGRGMLSHSGLAITAAEDLTDAARKVVAAVK